MCVKTSVSETADSGTHKLGLPQIGDVRYLQMKERQKDKETDIHEKNSHFYHDKRKKQEYIQNVYMQGFKGGYEKEYNTYRASHTAQ